jgi:hypothetical protein
LSYGTYDLFLAGLLYGAAAAAYNLTGLTLTTSAAGKTITRSTGNWSTDGVKVGDYVTTSGFANAGNNSTYKVTNVAATVLTLATAPGGADESAKTGCSVTTTRKVITDSTTPSWFFVEDRYTDIPAFISGKNFAVNALNLKVEPGKVVTGSFEFVGGSAVVAGVTVAGGTTAVTTTPVIDTFQGSLSEGGSTLTAIVTGLDLSINRGLAPGYAAFQDGPVQITSDKLKITGNLGTYFNDTTLLSKFISKTDTSLDLVLQASNGDKIQITLAAIEYTGGKRSNRDADVLVSLPFKAKRDPAKGYTIMIQFIPA